METQKKKIPLLLIILTFILGNLSTQYFNIQSHILLLIDQSYKIDSGSTQNQPIKKVALPSVVQQVQKPSIQIEKIGDKFTLWNLEYQVISAVNFSPAYDFQKTSGKYIGLKIKVSNTGKAESGVNRIYIKDSEDRQYESTVLGYQQLSVKDYGMEKIQAGISETYGVIFEVAKDSKGLKLFFPSAEGAIVANVQLGL